MQKNEDIQKRERKAKAEKELIEWEADRKNQINLRKANSVQEEEQYKTNN